MQVYGNRMIQDSHPVVISGLFFLLYVFNLIKNNRMFHQDKETWCKLGLTVRLEYYRKETLPKIIKYIVDGYNNVHQPNIHRRLRRS